MPVSSVAALVGGGTPSRSNPAFFGGSIPWVTPSDLPPIGEVALLKTPPQTITEQGLTASSARLLPASAVLYSSRASIGKVAITERPCATNQGFINFIPDARVLDPWFLAYWLCYKTPEITALAGETTYKEVSRGKMKDFPVWLPPLPMQQKIVRFIRGCYTRIDEVGVLHEECDGDATRLFTSTINSIIREEWPSRSLAEACTEIRNGWSGRQDSSGRQVGVLRLSCVHGLQVDEDDVKPALIDQDSTNDFALKQRDVFVVRGNGSKHLVGRSAISTRSNESVIFNDLLIRLRFREFVVPEFANYVLHSGRCRAQIEALAKTAAGIWKINQTNLGLVTIPCPSTAIQCRVISVLDESKKLSQELSAISHELDVEQLRNAILRKAFGTETGAQ
jgi:type I restriction enzyme, S subunit